MSEETSMRDRILHVTERRVRDSGYHGVSFRDVAADVGIKSSSVHHHFPTKEDLGAAVADAYTEQFMAALGDPADRSRTPRELLSHYVNLFRKALVEDGQMCLCGVLASETQGLPLGVRRAVRKFFERNIAWLEIVMRRKFPRADDRTVHRRALQVIASLEGAMLLATGLDSQDAFEAVAASLEGG